jgi:hypothetical protein
MRFSASRFVKATPSETAGQLYRKMAHIGHVRLSPAHDCRYSGPLPGVREWMRSSREVACDGRSPRSLGQSHRSSPPRAQSRSRGRSPGTPYLFRHPEISLHFASPSRSGLSYWAASRRATATRGKSARGGLIQALPPLYFASTALLTVSLFLELFRRDRSSTLVLAAHLIGLVVLLHGAPGFLEQEPRFDGCFVVEAVRRNYTPPSEPPGQSPQPIRRVTCREDTRQCRSRRPRSKRAAWRSRPARRPGRPH